MLEVLGLASGSWSSLINLLVYCVMLALFCIGLIKCIAPVVSNRRLLNRAIKNIKAGADAKRSWQEDKFLGRGTLYAHWSEYLNNLFFADGAYHNPSSVEDYINEETVIYGPGRSAFADAIPGILVSLGFLGTLIGIAMGLSGFDMTSAETVQSSIVTLIPGMRYAFTTSIVGVVLSVSFNLITRVVNGSAMHTIDAFYASMSRYAGVLSVDPMTQIAIYQQEQTAMIRKMSDQFAKDIGAAVQTAVKPLAEAFNSYVTVTSQEQMRFLDRVVGRFIDRMDASLNGQFSNLSRVIQETCAAQEKSLRLTESSLLALRETAGDITDLQKAAQTVLDRFALYMKSVEEAQNRTEEGMERMQAGIEKIDIVTKQQTSYLKNVNQLQRDMAVSVEEFRAVNEAFTKKMYEACGMTSDSMQASAEALNEAGHRLAETQAQLSGQINADLSDAFDNFERYMAEFTRTVNAVAGSIEDSIKDLPRSVTAVSNRLLDEADRLADSVHEANVRLDRNGTRR